jgi:hypothetical protein
MNEFPQVAQHRRTQLASSENIHFTLTVQELSNGYRDSAVIGGAAACVQHMGE